MTDLEPPQILTLPEVAARLRRSQHVVARMIDDDELPVVQRAARGRAATLNWTLIQQHIDRGGELTPLWWKLPTP